MHSYRLMFLIGISVIILALVCKSCRGELVTGFDIKRIVDFDDQTCREADIVLQHDAVRSRIECVTMCVKSIQCSCVFHKTGHCQGCSSCHAHGPFLDLPGTRYYYLPPDLSQYAVQSFGSHFYIFINELLPWEESKVNCNDLGMQLVEIYSATEHNWIITQLVPNGYYWTGGRKVDNAYVWWWTYQPMTYLRWAPNEPKGGGCVSLLGLADFLFDDYPCTGLYRSICKSL